MIQHISGAGGAPPMLGDIESDDPVWDEVKELAQAVLTSAGPPEGFILRKLPMEHPSAEVYAGVAQDRRTAPTTVVVVVSATEHDRPSRRELRRRFGLTAREVDVALLLAERCSNKEIARQLSIAHRTAGKHTENVMAKLNTSSRRDVARILRSRARKAGGARYASSAFTSWAR
jgi:DNA-binding CsgD family transcriptional regulator